MTAILRQETDHAVRLLLQLVDTRGRYIPIREAAGKAEASIAFAHKIIQKLAHAGIVDCRPGPAGGVSLVSAPGSIRLLEVIEVLQGKIALSRCTDYEKSCPRQERCSLHTKISWLQTKLIETFSDVTLADLIEES